MEGNKVSRAGIDDQIDARQAYETFKAARTLFFILLILGLLVTESSFWLVNCGLVDDSLVINGQRANLTPLLFSNGDERAWENIQHPQVVEGANDLIRISLGIWNYILTFCALLFCLTLLVGLNLALVGRLGGLADAGKAFFLSLVVMIMVVPWQPIITRQMPGALFSYEQLINSYQDFRLDSGLLSSISYYGRYVGLWFLTMILLLLAFWRSGRAAKKIKVRMNAGQNILTLKELESIST